MWDFDIYKILDLFEYDKSSPMIFSSGFFMFLFLGFITVYSLLSKKYTLRILFVTIFSYYFYYKSSGFYFFLLGIVTITDYAVAKLMHSKNKISTRRLLLLISVLINLGLLTYFKYTNFFIGIYNSLTSSSKSLSDIFLPVGISFFTFQSMSYTIDIYRKKISPLNSLLDYAFYVSFFPQLVAGPIVRAKDFIPQIRSKLFVSKEMFGHGFFFIFTGLFKKAIISDYISVNFVERIFDNPSLYSGIENLMGVYGYALQIYCDFSGYSDMAIGIALLLGFKFPMNFNSPYKSTSITDFWRRWHISLSSWLKDYLYISLGGNRKGKIRTYINLIITMLLGGLWHGASWNFVVWGGIHGIALSINKIWMSLINHKADYKPNPIISFISIFFTFNLVCFAWIFFRNSSFDSSVTMITQIFNSFSIGILPQLYDSYKLVFIMMLFGYVLHFMPTKFEEYFKSLSVKSPLLVKIILLCILIYMVVQIKSSDIQPFIYFQF